MKLSSSVVATFALCISTLCLTGCSSDFVTVTGTVTLDGEPLENAFVEFTPQVDGGSMAYGRTDSQGKYDMMFSMSQKGAMPGENIVRITTADVGDEGAANSREQVPRKYNVESVLRVNVEAGTANAFDFPLTTDGADVVQPKFDPNA